MKEKDLQVQILELLHLAGITAWLTHKVGAYMHKPVIKGIADIVGIVKMGCHSHTGFGCTESPCPGFGMFLAIEVKLPGRKATPDQLAFLEEVRLAGGIAFVAESIEDVILTLKENGVWQVKKVHLQ